MPTKQLFLPPKSVFFPQQNQFSFHRNRIQCHLVSSGDEHVAGAFRRPNHCHSLYQKLRSHLPNNCHLDDDEEKDGCNLDLLDDDRPGAGDALGRQRVDSLEQLPAGCANEDHIKLWAVRGWHLRSKWWCCQCDQKRQSETWGSTAIEVNAMLSPVRMRTGWLKKGGTASFMRGCVLMKFKLASFNSLLLFGHEPANT